MLSERVVRDAKSDGKTRVIWDNRIRGLGLRVTAKGVKSYVLNYRFNGRERRMTLGRDSEISLKDAQKKAAEHLEGIRLDGIDPLEVREAARQEARQAPIVQDGLDYYFDEYAPAKIKDGLLKQSTVDDYEQQARKYLRPALGKLRIADVQRGDVEKALPSVIEDPKTGRLKNAVIRNRVLTFISSLFSLFGEKGWRAAEQ